jgi:hypothetical protein
MGIEMTVIDNVQNLRVFFRVRGMSEFAVNPKRGGNISIVMEIILVPLGSQ